MELKARARAIGLDSERWAVRYLWVWRGARDEWYVRAQFSARVGRQFVGWAEDLRVTQRTHLVCQLAKVVLFGKVVVQPPLVDDAQKSVIVTLLGDGPLQTLRHQAALLTRAARVRR